MRELSALIELEGIEQCTEIGAVLGQVFTGDLPTTAFVVTRRIGNIVGAHIFH